MRSYKEFKCNFRHEDYLGINNHSHRVALCKLRISAHTLAIERGRYTRPITPLEERTCKHCHANKIEDEEHFLLECPKYDKSRESLLQKVSVMCNHFDELCQRDKFIYLLSGGMEVAKLVAAFAYENMP